MVGRRCSAWSLTGCRHGHRPRGDSRVPGRGTPGSRICGHFTSVLHRTRSVKETKALSQSLSPLIISSFSSKLANPEHHQSSSPSCYRMCQCWMERNVGVRAASLHSRRSTWTGFPGVRDGNAESKAKGDAPLQGLSSFRKDDRLHDRDRHTSAQDPRGQAISGLP